MTIFMEPTMTWQLSQLGQFPTELADSTTATCTAGYAWCAFDCHDEDPYHYGNLTSVDVLEYTGTWDEASVEVGIRVDENVEPDSAGRPLVLFDTLYMSAGQARIAAAWLLNAADQLDPLPTGAMAATAVNVRIGDELLTEDGWQTVTGLLFDATTEQASVFTVERTMDDSDGWDLSFNDPVKVRRPVHGSCAIQFVEPAPAVGGTK